MEVGVVDMYTALIAGLSATHPCSDATSRKVAFIEQQIQSGGLNRKDSCVRGLEAAKANAKETGKIDRELELVFGLALVLTVHGPLLPAGLASAASSDSSHC